MDFLSTSIGSLVANIELQEEWAFLIRCWMIWSMKGLYGLAIFVGRKREGDLGYGDRFRNGGVKEEKEEDHRHDG